jgi:hypothetical protein
MDAKKKSLNADTQSKNLIKKNSNMGSFLGVKNFSRGCNILITQNIYQGRFLSP